MKKLIAKSFPSIITAGNAIAGFMGISFVFYLSSHDFSYEVIVLAAFFFLIFGFICDALDGFVARKLNTSSPFGEQLDSLADLITFGVMPATVAFINDTEHTALIIIVWSVFVSTAYVLASSYRLARYNAGKGTEDEQDTHFLGLPMPAAAVVFLGLLYFEHYYNFYIFDGFIPLIIGSLMISTFQYPHILKDPRTKKISITFFLFATLLSLGMLLAGINKIYLTLFAISFISIFYAALGPLLFVKKKWKEKKRTD